MKGKRRKLVVGKDKDDPVLQMRGVGKEIWADIGSDAFVNSLRTGWELTPKKRSEPRRRKPIP
jgi:hypothetical protein